VTNGSKKQPATSTRTQQAEAGHLLGFEKVPFVLAKDEPKATDEELNSRYAKGEIRIVTEQARYPLAGILGMLKEEIEGENGPERRYKLDPEYQRRHRWSDERKSRLIESFLINVPVPPVFLYERDLARFEVMDGRQRLNALSEFYADGFALKGLQYWSDLDGRKYSELPSKVRDGIDRRYISSIILLKETAANEEQAARLKKMVFERLNSGGVKLGSQETRNAVYDGPLNRLCIDLSANPKFRQMWDIPLDPQPEVKNADEEEAEMDKAIDDSTTSSTTTAGIHMFEKMEDVELVLRFFAYRKIGEFKAGLNKISEFLDRFIVAGNQFPEKGIAQYRSMFEATIDFLWEVLGSEAFTVLDPAKRRPTKIVYDPLMFAANLPGVVPHRAKLVARKAVLRTELSAMYKDNRALFSGRKTNFKDTQDRNRCVSGAFASAIAKTAKTAKTKKV
jgi:Protein of unknown function DUF262